MVTPTRLKDLLAGGEFILAPGVFEMFSARIADRMGFKALYMTGYGVSASHLGLPDAGLVTYTDMVGRARTIVEGTTTPLIADADTGFGGLINVRQTVRGYEAAGVQAIQIEDQEMPKKCGHTPNRRVVPLADMLRRIEVAVESRRHDDTLIIARTDSRTGLGLDEAIHRGKAFAKAGADVVFVEAPESAEEFRRVGDSIDAWLLANMVPTGKSPEIARSDLQAWGFDIAIYPSAGMGVICAALEQNFAWLKDHGSTAGSPVPAFDMAQLHELVGFPDVWAFEKKHVEGGSPVIQETQAAPRTLFDKLWDSHVIADLGEGAALLHVDRHLVHDLGGPAFKALEQRGLQVRNPALTFATPDHVVSSAPGRTGSEHRWAEQLIGSLRQGSRERGIRLFDVNQPGQGIVHVIGPELGLTLPGSLVLCGDSHTSTHGALGALAWGIGASEIVHVLATQTIVQKRPLRMRITVTGELLPGVEAKDLIIAIIARLGAAAGTGFAVEYDGPVIERLSMAGRLTLCNMSIEMGARIGMIAPDDVTFDWLKGRPFAPRGAQWDQALASWKALATDPDARFDREERIDAATIGPQITWGTSPAQAIRLDERVPDPADAPGSDAAAAILHALQYMGLEPGQAIAGTAIDRVFIGSCTNGRIEDLREAAATVRGRRVAPHVRAWVVPGSEDVRRTAEHEGLDRTFRDAGFEWRSPGCSLCVGANGEMVASQERCVSTSNRNFVGRQGPGARTHLANPSVAAACAIAGCIVDRLPERLAS